MIELNQVRKVYPGPNGAEVVAVDDLSLQVDEGEMVCLVGTSGCGKTTTMKMINRMIEPTSGAVRVAGSDVLERDPIQLRRSIGYVLQAGGLFPHMTVRKNIGLVCELEGWARARTDARVDELLEMVNLPAAEFSSRYPAELSGGQRQRVGVARALALDPKIVLMDEPFGAVDPITRDQLHSEFLELRRKFQKTIIMVTHDMQEAFKLGDRVAVMHEGQLLQVGTREALEASSSKFVAAFVRGQESE